MTGKAQNTCRGLTQEAKAQYATAKFALHKRFKPDSRRELYAVEFQTRRRQQGESWTELANNLWLLANKAFPNLEEPAKEQLSLDRYLSFLDRSGQGLDVQQQDKLYTLLLSFANVFALCDMQLGRTDKLQHSINTKGSHPISQQPWRLLPF